MADDTEQPNEILDVLRGLIEGLHEEYEDIHREEVRWLTKKIALNKRIANLKGLVGNMELWYEVYDIACPTRKFDI